MNSQSTPEEPDEEAYFDKIKTIWFDFFDGKLSAAARDMQLHPFRERLAPLSPAHNFLMVETTPAKEASVAEAIDALVGIDSSYCPMYYDIHRVARHDRRRGKAIKSNPVLPRCVFITASFPDIPAVLAIQGVESIIRNPYGAPEIIPGWEMGQFQAEVEKRRLWCLKMASKGTVKTKAPKFGSFAALKAWFDSNNGGESLSEDGEILISSQAA